MAELLKTDKGLIQMITSLWPHENYTLQDLKTPSSEFFISLLVNILNNLGISMEMISNLGNQQDQQLPHPELYQDFRFLNNICVTVNMITDDSIIKYKLGMNDLTAPVAKRIKPLLRILINYYLFYAMISKQQIEPKQEVLDSQIDELNDLTAKINQLSEEIANIECSNSQEEENTRDLQQMLYTNQQRLQKLQDVIKTEESKLNNVKEEEDVLTDEHKSLLWSLEQLKKEEESLKKELVYNFAELKKYHDIKLQQESGLKANISQVKSINEKRNDILNILDCVTNQLKTNMTSIKDELFLVNEEVTNLTVKYNRECERLIETNNDELKSINSFEEMKKGYEEKQNNLVKIKERLTSSKSEYEKKLSAINKEIADTKKYNKINENQQKGYENRIRIAEEVIQENEKLKNDIDNFYETTKEKVIIVKNNIDKKILEGFKKLKQ